MWMRWWRWGPKFLFVLCNSSLILGLASYPKACGSRSTTPLGQRAPTFIPGFETGEAEAELSTLRLQLQSR